jgi:two-component system response regulator HydG
MAQTGTGSVQTAAVEASAPTILVVDDDALVLRAVHRTLTSQGYSVLCASNGSEAVAIAKSREIDVALIDLYLGDMDGLAVLKVVKAHHPAAECLIVTGVSDVSAAHKSLEEGASDYFEKPIKDWVRFNQVLRRAAELCRLKKEKEVLQRRMDSQLSGLLGRSKAMQPVRQMVERVADSRASLLLIGESGVGKEVIAEAVHRLSGRKGAFVKLNCAAVPSELLEAELFGYAKGAHSTAHRSKPGLFETAEHGTILLDEIGEMAYDMQAKLLRVLENGTFRRIGETDERTMTARVLAATNANLQDSIDRGRFREDLYHRLNVIKVHIPPLRHRQEDIPMLVYRFIVHFNGQEARNVRRVPDAVMHRLRSYSWPGNVRELRNVIHRAVLLSADSELSDASLGDALSGRSDEPTTARPSQPGIDPQIDIFDQPYANAKAAVVEGFTVRYLTHLLMRNGGNVTRAAAEAGMQRPNFRRLMRQFGVATPHTNVDS